MKLSNQGQHRLFFAICFEEDFEEAIAQWRSQLGIYGRLIEPHLFHITLHFLGSVKNHQIFNIMDAIETPNMPNFTLSFGTVASFLQQEVLFLNIDQGAESINKISRHIRKNLRSIQVPHVANKRKFYPHMTIAREVKPPLEFPGPDNLSTQCHSFCLMESLPAKTGVRYNIIEEWQLSKPSVKEQLLGRQLQ